MHVRAVVLLPELPVRIAGASMKWASAKFGPVTWSSSAWSSSAGSTGTGSRRPSAGRASRRWILILAPGRWATFGWGLGGGRWGAVQYTPFVVSTPGGGTPVVLVMRGLRS